MQFIVLLGGVIIKDFAKCAVGPSVRLLHSCVVKQNKMLYVGDTYVIPSNTVNIAYHMYKDVQKTDLSER